MLHVDLIAPIATLLDRHAKQRPEKVAYSDSSREVTYAALAERTAAIAANLARAGLKEGDKIAIYLPNGVDWIEACFAALRAGAVVVPISFDAAEGEISYRLTDAGFVVLEFVGALRKRRYGDCRAHERGEQHRSHHDISSSSRPAALFVFVRLSGGGRSIARL